MGIGIISSNWKWLVYLCFKHKHQKLKSKLSLHWCTMRWCSRADNLGGQWSVPEQHDNHHLLREIVTVIKRLNRWGWDNGIINFTYMLWHSWIYWGAYIHPICQHSLPFLLLQTAVTVRNIIKCPISHNINMHIKRLRPWITSVGIEHAVTYLVLYLKCFAIPQM